MKNKLFYLLLILVVSFLCINNVFAGEFVITPVVDNTTVVKGNDASIKINLKSSEAIGECLFKFENDSVIEYVSIASANGWVVNQNGVDGVNITNSSLSAGAPTSGQNIAELKYKINGDGKVVIKTVQCVSTISETSYKFDDITVNFIAKDVTEDTTLSSLKVTNGSMTPSNISPDHTGSYIINLNSSTFGLSMTASNPEYQDDIVVTDIDGKVIENVSNITFSDPSNQGQMPLTITVNDKTTYSLLVTYVQKELDNSLESLTINGEKIALVDGQYNYEYMVSEDVTGIAVAATLKDNNNFEFGSASNAPGTFTINDFVDIIIVVEPKDSSSGAKAVTYTIEVTKEGSSGTGEEEKENSSNGGNTNTNPGSNNNNNNNVNNNPGTSDIPMYLMAFILVVSLIGSVVLYQKNLESYK